MTRTITPPRACRARLRDRVGISLAETVEERRVRNRVRDLDRALRLARRRLADARLIARELDGDAHFASGSITAHIHLRCLIEQVDDADTTITDAARRYLRSITRDAV